MNVLITGACGYIGRKLVDQLCHSTWVDCVVGTDWQQTEYNHPRFVFYRRDIRDSMDDIFAREQIESVVHTAYILPPIHNGSLMEDINVGGTNNILSTAARYQIKHLLYTSSTTAYGFYPDNETPLREDSPLRGNDDFVYAKNKKEIEALIAEFVKKNPAITTTVIRPCFVVGPGFSNPLALHLRKKLVALPANTRPWQFVHEDDVVDVMTMLLQKRIGGAYNVAGEGTMTFGEMVRELGNIMIPVPWSLLFPLNNLAWHLRLRCITKFPSCAMHMMVNPWISSSEKLVSTTGYTFKYTTRQAFTDFVQSVGA